MSRSARLKPAANEEVQPHISPVLKEMLHERIFLALKRNLMIGRFSPGQRLPLRGLAQSLGTSLMPVRDALQRLESLGCLVSSPTRVMMVPELTSKELTDIRTLRMLVEGHAAASAAIHRTEGDILNLDKFCQDMERSADENNLDLFLEANYFFHMTIADTSNVTFARAMLEPLWMRIGPSVRKSKPDERHIRKAVTVHRRVLSAIRRGKDDAARSAICEDIVTCDPHLGCLTVHDRP